MTINFNWPERRLVGKFTSATQEKTIQPLPGQTE